MKKAEGPESLSEAKGRRVLVAMSGGVDSSVSAALLKKQGFSVAGGFIRFEKKDNRCCSSESEKMARLICSKLNIPFYVFDFSKEFKKEVINYFISEYKAGRTPNPCVVCNKKMKFGLLLERANKLGMEYIATGHYARLRREIQNPNFQCQKLLKAKDKNKDQSYFLWQLNKKILDKTLFPIGDYTKSVVRKMAKDLKLPVYNTPDSQEVCFVNKNVNEFLKGFINPKKGIITDKKGNKLGEHQGLCFYTIGQRKGIGSGLVPLSGTSAGKPFYVIKKDVKRNILVVSNDKKDLLRKDLVVKNINWLEEPKFPLKVMVKIRYQHNSSPAIVSKPKNGKCLVKFLKPQKAITSGQSAVFYIKNQVIGGGIIN